MTVKVFLSYKRESQATVQSIYEALQTWNFTPWMDVHGIPKGVDENTTSWMDAIDHGLRESQVIIACITPLALQSENVRQEWAWGKTADRRMIFLRLAPFDNENMPHQFAGVNYIDFVANPAEGLLELKKALADYAQSPEAQKPLEDVSWPSTDRILNDLDELKEKAPDIKGKRRARAWRFLLVGISLLIVILALAVFISDHNIGALSGLLAALLPLLGLFYVRDGDVELTRSGDESFDQLRDRIRRYWLEGSLRPGLEEVRTLGIPLSLNQQAVFKHKKWLDTPIHHSLNIRTVYDNLNSFLVLGNPGSGKTTVMLQLALSLLKKRPPENAAPFLLNLSTWHTGTDLYDWICAEGKRTYNVSAKLIQRWLGDRRLILLLDGFDEVQEKERSACIIAINQFHEKYKDIHLIVATRTAEYDLATNAMQNEVFNLNGAIELKGLTEAQIASYLEAENLAGLRSLYNTDPAVKQLAQTPFLLNCMAYTYAKKQLTALNLEDNSLPERQAHLFDAYVVKRLNNPIPLKNYKEIKRWLGWLATKLGYYGTIFRIQDVDWRWFDDMPDAQRVLKRIITAIPFLILIPLWALWGNSLAAGWGALWLGIIGGLFALGLSFIESYSSKEFHISFRHLKNTLNNLGTNHQLLFVILMMLLTIEPFFALWLTQLFSEIIAWSVVGVSAGTLFSISWWLIDRWEKLGEGVAVVIFVFLTTPITWMMTHIVSNNPFAGAALIAITTVTIIVTAFGLERKQNTRFSQDTALDFLLPTLLSAIFSFIPMSNIWPILALFSLAMFSFWGIEWMHRHFPPLLLLYTQPLRLQSYLDLVRSRQILREMGGGYTFRHDTLRMSLLGEGAGFEAQILIHIREIKDNYFFPDQNSLAIDSYGRHADKVLISALSHSDSRIRKNAGTYLKHKDLKLITPQILVQYLIAIQNWDALIIFRNIAVERLIALLKDGNYKVRSAAAHALGELQDAHAVDPLITLLKDEYEDVRQESARTLGKLQDAYAVDFFIALLKDEDMNVRCAAAHALGELQDERAVDPLIALLKDRDEVVNVRQKAAHALGELKDARVVEPLIALLKSNDLLVRGEVAHALGELQDQRAVDPLIAFLKDRNEDVRKKATYSSIVLGYEEENIRLAITYALGKLKDERAVDPLIALLKDGDKNVRSTAAHALGELQDERAVDPLIALLKDGDEVVGRQSARALGKLHNTYAIDFFISLLKDNDSSISSAAAHALGELQDERAVDPLIALLRNGDWRSRSAAADALGALKNTQAVELLFPLLKDGDRDVRSAAANTLGLLQDAHAFEPLLSLLNDEDWQVCSAAVRALGQIGDARAFEPLLSLLNDENVRYVATVALGQIGDARAFEPLLSLLKNDDYRIRSTTVRALGQLRDARAIPSLLKLFEDDKSLLVWESAVWALGQLGDEAINLLIALVSDDSNKR